MPAFDPDDNAEATLKERLCWMAYMGGFFFILYGSANLFAAQRAPHLSLMMAWESAIPFIDWMIVPYMSSDLIFCLTFLLPHTRFEVRLLAARILVLVIVSVLVFVFFPFQFGAARPEPSHLPLLFDLLQADRPYNQLPSLHVGFTVVLWASMRRHIRPIWCRAAVLGWFGLIVVSTLTVYQHHCIDLPAGFAAGLFSLFMVPATGKGFLTRHFMAPRHLKMGCFYLAAAAVFLAVALRAGPFASLPAWIGISLLCVSIVYCFGLHTLPAGSDARARWYQWLVFAPYFIGARLFWYYYRRGLTLAVRVDDGVFFGRLPARKEYAVLQDYPVRTLINLALEHQIGRSPLEERRYALLDMTLQSPQVLHQVVEAIEAHRAEGVFVHCALGLSRSVLAISAWLLFRGWSRAEIDTLMRRFRPAHVHAVYMELSLDLYERFLQTGILPVCRKYLADETPEASGTISLGSQYREQEKLV